MEMCPMECFFRATCRLGVRLCVNVVALRYRRGMADEYEDPSGSTMAFRAYMNRQEQEQQAEAAPVKSSNLPLIIGGVVAAVAVVAVVLFFVL